MSLLLDFISPGLSALSDRLMKVKQGYRNNQSTIHPSKSINATTQKIQTVRKGRGAPSFVGKKRTDTYVFFLRKIQTEAYLQHNLVALR